jgi:myosin heavy subunit
MTTDTENSENSNVNQSKRGLLFGVFVVGSLLASNAGTGWMAFQQKAKLVSFQVNAKDNASAVSQLKNLVGTLEKTRDLMKKRLKGVVQEKETAQGTLENTKDQFSKANDQINKLSDLQKRLSADLKGTREALGNSQSRETRFVKQVDKLNEQLKDSETRQKEMLRLIRQIKEENQKTHRLLGEKAQLAQALKKSLSQVEGFLLRLEKEHKINVRRRLGIDPVPNVKALVVGIKIDATPQLLAINAGFREKLQVDDFLYISRKGKLIGEARVTEISKDRKSRSVAKVLTVVDGEEITEGDTVTTLPPKTGT